jgi:hypothetical protein
MIECEIQIIKVLKTNEAMISMGNSLRGKRAMISMVNWLKPQWALGLIGNSLLSKISEAKSALSGRQTAKR